MGLVAQSGRDHPKHGFSRDIPNQGHAFGHSSFFNRTQPGTDKRDGGSSILTEGHGSQRMVFWHVDLADCIKQIPQQESNNLKMIEWIGASIWWDAKIEEFKKASLCTKAGKPRVHTATVLLDELLPGKEITDIEPGSKSGLDTSAGWWVMRRLRECKDWPLGCWDT